MDVRARGDGARLVHKRGGTAVERGVVFQVSLQALRIRSRVGGSIRYELGYQGIEGGSHLGLQRFVGGRAGTASLGGKEGEQQESPGDCRAHGFRVHIQE